jgi:phosphocarrier protein FPr
MTEEHKAVGNEPMRRTLLSPLTGVAVPIEHAPDPVFAQKMVGDGISIDPVEGLLVAPCDGEVVQLHDSYHAVTIRSEDNIDILIHIGIDTVGMKGKGFSPQVKVGDHVQTGQALIEFDLATVAVGAPYLMTQIVVTNMDRVTDLEVAPQGKIETEDFLLSYNVVESSTEASTETGDFLLSDPIYLCNTVGLHARPAAQLTQLLADFSSDVELRLDDKTANARSITALLKLNSQYGDPVVVAARGADAEAVLKKWCRLFTRV